MAEGRMLKRRITLSKKMAALNTDKARLLWFYMLPFTDVEGRINADPEDIRDEILRKQRKGYVVSTIQTCLEELHRVGLIILYQNETGQYLQFTRHAKEQNLRRDREAESQIPAPLPEDSGSSPAISKVKLSKVKLSEDKDKNPPTPQGGNGFEVFWKAYPRKVGKGHARKAWQKLKPSKSLIVDILAKIEAFKRTDQWTKENGQYIPYPATWLNQERWDDEIRNNRDGKRSDPNRRGPAGNEHDGRSEPFIR